MSEVEQTCRICRGEDSASQPLIHPCKCRGSIKYIHQDCLLEWLNHSNNKEKRCDICNTAYIFKTIYDPEMPSRMPTAEIYHKLVLNIKRAFIKNISFLLYAFCIAQLSVFWMFVGRMFTYIADERISSPDITVLHTLLYGAYDSRTRSGVLFTSPEATSMDKLDSFVIKTVVHGTLQVLIFIVVLVVIFIEHEWVIREDGYKALLIRQMGKRPRTRLADLLSSLAQNGNGEGANPNEMMINRALDDLRRVQDTQVHENALRAAIEHRQFDNLLPNAINIPRNPLPDIDLHDPDTSPSTDLPSDSSSHEAGDANSQATDTQRELFESNEDSFNLNGQDAGVADPELSDDESFNEPEERERMMEDLEAAELAENGNLWEALGFKLDLATPIQLMIFADTAILIFLLVAYLMPHTIGKFVLLVCATTAIGLNYVFVQPLLALPGVKYIPELISYARREIQIPPFLETMLRGFFVEPVVEAFGRMANNQPLSSPSLLGRSLSLLVGYFIICVIFHNYMSILVAGPKPIVGRSRKIYESMFQITATAKVFMIFASEIVLFPLYCGWLIDFCIAPLVNTDIVAVVNDRLTLYPFSTVFSSLGLYSKSVLYWVLGTFYMFCVALFVSMIRRSILRPGVLYFIKSPEDPNARLIHDAIVKPFFLQMSRIFLSAKVYTAFVVLGIGSVTWGLRLLVNPPFSDGALLPLQMPSFYECLVLALTIWVLFSVKNIIATQVLSFWQKSFAVLSHKFRLSHFLLGEPVPQERGYVIYRSFFHSLLGIGIPDYSKPVSYSEAQEIFRNDSNVTACFVPDGTYMRVPSSDDNSRKFLRSLFVPVTKSDQLISPAEPLTENDESDWWDENALYDDNYTIVYTPPNYKLRCLALMCMVILFGALLIVSVGMVAALLGRPIITASLFVTRNAFKGSNSTEDQIKWKFLDVSSLCAGLITLAQVLFMMSHRPNSAEVRNFVVDQGRRAVPVIRDYLVPMCEICRSTLSVYFHYAIIGAVYFTYIPEVEKYWLGEPTLQVNTEDFKFKFSWPGLLLNAFMLPFTVIPLVLFFYSKKPGPETWRGVVSSTATPQTLGSLGYLVIHRTFLFAAERQGVMIDRKESVYLRMGVLLAIAVTHALISGLKLLNGVNEQIKNEKYVRGTAIHNVGTDD